MRLTKIAALVGAAAVAMPIGLATTAEASPWLLVDRDDISINGGHSDFQGNVSYYLRNGVVRAVPNGRVSQDHLPGHCVRTRATYYDANGTFIVHGIVGMICSTSSGNVQGPVVKHTFQQDNIAYVKLSTQVQLSNGRWSTTKSALSTLDDV